MNLQDIFAALDDMPHADVVRLKDYLTGVNIAARDYVPDLASVASVS